MEPSTLPFSAFQVVTWSSEKLGFEASASKLASSELRILDQKSSDSFLATEWETKSLFYLLRIYSSSPETPLSAWMTPPITKAKARIRSSDK